MRRAAANPAARVLVSQSSSISASGTGARSRLRAASAAAPASASGCRWRPDFRREHAVQSLLYIVELVGFLQPRPALPFFRHLPVGIAAGEYERHAFGVEQFA